MSEIKVLDPGYVKYVEHWGSDERIVESARMSTNKGFQGWEKICPECDGSGKIHSHNPLCDACGGRGKVEGDGKLLTFLATHGHTSPFEQAGLVIEVQAPIFVFREWHRHRTQSYNELSARYTELPDLFYVPDLDRLIRGKQSKKNKQGSEEGYTSAQAHNLQTLIRNASAEAILSYRDLLDKGVARELARLVVPVNMYSRMRASANLWNWIRFLNLRTSKDAQWEIRQYANVVDGMIKDYFPRTHRLFRP